MSMHGDPRPDAECWCQPPMRPEATLGEQAEHYSQASIGDHQTGECGFYLSGFNHIDVPLVSILLSANIYSHYRGKREML